MMHIFIIIALVLLCPAKAQDIHIDETYLIEPDQERIQLTLDYFQVHHPEIGERIKKTQKITFQPQVIVIHYTVFPTLEKVLETFKPNTIASSRTTVSKNGSLNVGVQFIIDRDGTIYRLYPENQMARHTIGLNHVAIGIENIADDDFVPVKGENHHPMTHAQLDANLKLVQYLKEKYPKIEHVIGHAEYQDLEAPTHPAHHLFYEAIPNYRTQKQDPGQIFMQLLRERLKKE